MSQPLAASADIWVWIRDHGGERVAGGEYKSDGVPGEGRQREMVGTKVH